MPDYRKLHNAHGNSQTLATISDYEFRVWTQYRASADDFGVCPLNAAKLQGDNRRLARDPASKVMKALKQLIEVGLVIPFAHQGLDYICQRDWQDFEDIRYPRNTSYPVPSPQAFALLSEKTAELFRNDSRKDSAKFPHLARAGAPETLTFTKTRSLTQTETDPQIEGEGAGEGVPEPNDWTRLVDALAGEIGEQSLGLWFRPCRLLGTYPDALRVQVPSPLFLEWIPKHYSRILAEVGQRLFPDKSLRFEIHGDAKRRAS
jgi:hypothetical protein